jgi:hypothetical protein
MNRMGICVLFTVNLLCLLAGSAFAISWAKVYDLPSDNFGARDIQPTPDGGFIVIGDGSFQNGANVWVMKLTSTGSVSWQKSYGGGPTLGDYTKAVRTTSDGGYILATVTRSFGEGDRDGWILKLSSTGGIQWQQSYGGTRWDEIRSIQQTSDGGFVFAGFTRSFNDPTNGDAWVAKISSTGGSVWQMSFGSSNTLELIDDIYEIPGGGLICAGRRAGDAWVMRLTPTGKIKWQKSYGGSGTDSAYRIQRTPDGDFVVAGNTDSFGGGGTHVWLLKLNRNGAILWQKVYADSLGYDTIGGLDNTSDGGTILTGLTDSYGPPYANAWAVKLDSSGGIIWQKTYGGGWWDTGLAVHQTSDGSYVIAGQTSSFGGTPHNAWVLKLESDGNIGFSCSIINSSTAPAVNTNAVTTILAISSVSIPVKVNVTSAVPVNISTTIMQLC